MYMVDMTDRAITLTRAATVGQAHAPEHIRYFRTAKSSTWTHQAGPETWPILDFLTARDGMLHFEDLPPSLRSQTDRGYGDKVTSAAIVSIGEPALPRAVLICGLNTRSAFDDAYRAFLSTISKTLNTSLLILKELETDEIRRISQANARRAEESELARKQQETFVDVVHHEIRNPTSAIVQASSLLEGNFLRLQEIVDGIDPADFGRVAGLEQALRDMRLELDEGHDTARVVSTAARHQQVISGDILSASKLANGLLNISPIDVLLVETCESIVRLFTVQADAADIELRIIYGKEIAPDLVLRVDPTRLAQIIMNLLTNSLRLLETHDGVRRCTIFVNLLLTPPPLNVRPAVVPDQKPERFSKLTEPFYLVVSVQDTGPGMDYKSQGRLFTRFNEVDHTAPENRLRGGGTGLGLYLCLRLAELQSGAIGVFSEQDVGTTFTFYISVSVGDRNGLKRDMRARQVRMGHSTDSLSRRTSEGNHVLIVEDNAVAAKLLKRQLEKESYRISLASNGVEALQMIDQFGTELSACFLDVEMPLLNGRETIQRLRAIEAASGQRRLPVCAITGASHWASRALGLSPNRQCSGSASRRTSFFGHGPGSDEALPLLPGP
jgi:signal transduction histidine kinase